MSEVRPDEELGPVRRQSLPHDIARLVEKMILQEKYQPGQQIREAHLAAQLGTSQTPVREALRILEQRGVVTHTPNRGATVVNFGEQDVIQILKVREPLEILALEQARLNVTEELVGQLKRTLEELSVAAERNELLLYHEAHRQFHALVWAASGNSHLVAALQRLCAPLWAFYRQRVRNKKSRSLSGRRTHEPFVELITTDRMVRHEDVVRLVQEHFADVAGFEPSNLAAR
jgi:DNA-binding GntR family transcriptional regulator